MGNISQYLQNYAGRGVEFLDLANALASGSPGALIHDLAMRSQALQDPALRQQLQGSPFQAGIFGVPLGQNLPTPASAQMGPAEGPSVGPVPTGAPDALVPQLPPLDPAMAAQQQLIAQNPQAVARVQLGLPATDFQGVAAMTPQLMQYQQLFPGSRFTYGSDGKLHVSVGGASSPLTFTSEDRANALAKELGGKVFPLDNGQFHVYRPPAQAGLPQDVTLPMPTGAQAPNQAPQAAPAPVSDDEGPVEGLPPTALPVSPTGQVGAPTPAPAPQQAQAQPAPAPETGKIGFPSQAFNDPGGLVQNRQSVAQFEKPLPPTGGPTPSVPQGTAAPQPQPDAIQPMPLNVKSMTLKSKTRNVTLAPPKLTAQQVTEAENVKQIKSAIRETLQLLNQGSPRDFTIPMVGTIPKGGQTTGPLTSRAISLAGKLRDPAFSEGGKVPTDPLQVRQTLLESGFRRMFDVAFIFAGKRLTNQEIERMFKPLVPDMGQADDINRSKMLGINDILQNIDSERNKLLQLDPGEDKEGTFEGSPRGKALYGDIFGAQARRFLLLQQVPPPKRLDQAQPQP